MTDTTQAPLVTIEDMRKQLVVELDIADLPEDQQDVIITELSEVLVERAAIRVFNQIPEEEMEKMDTFMKEGNDTEAQKIMHQYVPNVAEVTNQVVKEGVEEYKQRVAGKMVNAQ